mgnify:CR=1 FL=1
MNSEIRQLAFERSGIAKLRAAAVRNGMRGLLGDGRLKFGRRIAGFEQKGATVTARFADRDGAVVETATGDVLTLMGVTVALGPGATLREQLSKATLATGQKSLFNTDAGDFAGCAGAGDGVCAVCGVACAAAGGVVGADCVSGSVGRDSGDAGGAGGAGDV